MLVWLHLDFPDRLADHASSESVVKFSMPAFAWRVSKLLVKFCVMHLSMIFFPFHPPSLSIYLRLFNTSRFICS